MILITGSTGFLGKHVTSLLSKRYKMRFLAREKSRKSDTEFLEKHGEIAYGDITDYSSLENASKGCLVIVHLATPPGSASYDRFYDVHVNGARNIIRACRKNRIKRVIVTSSVAALAREKSDYGRTKLMADKLFLKSGLDVSILRPGFIYGEGGGFGKLVDMIRSYPIIPIIGGGSYNKQPVHVKNVVQAIEKCLRGKTGIYNVCGPHISFENMIDMICAELGIKKRKVHIPKSMFMAATYMPARPAMLTKTVVLGMVHDSHIKSDFAKLGIKPIPFKKGLKDVVKHYK